MWVWNITISITFLALAMIGIIAFFGYRGQLSDPEQSTASATKEWLIAFTGPLAIMAALIAAIPVFEQLDEAKYATIALRIDVLRHTLESVDKEAASVNHIQKFLDALQSTPTPDQKSSFCGDDDEWGSITDTAIGFWATPDISPELKAPREAVSHKLDEINDYKKLYCENGSLSNNILPFMLRSIRELSPLIYIYQRGYHSYTQLRVSQLLILQARLNYDIPDAEQKARLDRLKDRYPMLPPE